MNIERARLIQALAKEEVANIALGMAAYNAETTDHGQHNAAVKWMTAECDWMERCEAAAFDEDENAAFQQVRAEFDKLMGR